MGSGCHDHIVITGIGITSAIGQGKSDFSTALLSGKHAFSVMARPGRQQGNSRFIGAEMGSLQYPDLFSAQSLRTVSLTGQAALVTLAEAWDDAQLSDVDPERIGLIVAGSNVQQRELVLAREKHRNNPHFLRPTYGLSFMDTDICGICTEYFSIRGMACTVGGASASGQMALIQGIQNIQAGLVDVCVVVGALMDLSCWECQGLRSLGAMGSDRFADNPSLACRPFDKDRDGFIFGESCGVLVLEKSDISESRFNQRSVNGRRASQYYATISGLGVSLDGNRNPNSNSEGEQRAIMQALQSAQLSSNDVDYINPHGSGSVSGDEVELEALQQCGLTEAWINSTKSILGHGLSSAGLVEVIATLLQMQKGELHPMRNWDKPMSNCFNWVGKEARAHVFHNALTLSFGFGGINTALCLQSL